MFAGRAISIRWSLLRSFMLLIVISSLTVLVLMTIRARRTEVKLSEELIERGTRLAGRELDRFFQPANDGTDIAVRWGLSGKLRLDGVVAGEAGIVTPVQRKAARRINTLLLPYLAAYRDILSSVQVANERSEGFLILRLPDGTVRNRVVSRPRWGTQTLWFDVDARGEVTSSEWKEVDYRPRERAWYMGVADAAPGEVRWTDPYIFFTTKDLGITASARWLDEGVEHVVAYDVLLTSVTEFTQGPYARVSKNAQALIATDDWRVIGLPRHPDYSDDAAIRSQFLKPLDELRAAAVRDAVAAADQQEEAKAVFAFESAGAPWWAGIASYSPGKGKTLRIAVLVPNEDLLEDVTQQRLFLLVATIVALAAALVFSLLLARSYSRPLEALAAQSRRISDLEFFESDVSVEANLRELRDLAGAQEQSIKALQSFSRYVPIDVVRELVSAGEVARIGGRTQDLTVLFSDIAGFTRISEGMTPQDLSDHLAHYFQALIDILQDHGATVDKMVGDAIVAFWGAPRPLSDHPAHGVRAVIECRKRLGALNLEWQAHGLPALPTRFGLSTGPVVVGNIGARSRLAYTVLGDTVNFASRLEGLNKVYGTRLLTDDTVHAACGPSFEWRRLDRVVVLGRTEPSFVYEILGAQGETPGQVTEAARRYEAAWDTYADRRFTDALVMLDALQDAWPDDEAIRRLRRLAAECLADPPSPAWDATTYMTKK